MWSTNRTDGLGVPSTGRQPKTAIDFVVFLANRGSQLRLERGEMPLDMRLAEQWAAGSEEQRQVFEALRHGRPYPFIPGYLAANRLVWQAWERMTEEGIPAKQALDALTDPLQAVLDQTWADFESIRPPGEMIETPVGETPTMEATIPVDETPVEETPTEETPFEGTPGYP
jgi:hypothetical protein